MSNNKQPNTMDNTKLLTNIKKLKATVTDSSDFPSSLEVAISGEALEMNINTFTTLEFLDAEELEIVELNSADGYASYTSDLFPEYIFYADVYFEREGTDWTISELQSPQLEIEIKNNLY